MRNVLRVLALIVLLLQTVSSTVHAQIHVGPGQPYPDLGSAVHARAVHAGDTVYIHAGTYRNSNYAYGIDSLIGTPDKWITIRPWQNDSVSINEAYTLQVCQYLRISGLRFYGNDPTQSARVYHQLYFDYEYNCFDANHDIIIENCAFDELNNTGKQGSGACLKFTGTDRFIVRNCTFRNGTNMADGISMNGDRNGVISHCTFENLSTYGSHCKGGSKNITYEKNLFVNCAAGGLDVGGDTGPAFFCPLGANWEADSINVFANVFIGGSTGIRLSDCRNSNVFNNTCFKSEQFAFRSLNASTAGYTLFNNHIYNNIFTTYSANRIYMNASAGGDYTTEYFKNNLFHDYKNPDPAAINWFEMPGVNVDGSIIGDPLFRDTAARDFSLEPGSPAIGAGVGLIEPRTDYRDKSYAHERSIGAYEFATAGVRRGIEANGLQVMPNPAASFLMVRWAGKGNAVVALRIRNALGQEVIRRSCRSQVECTIPLGELSSGVYIIELRNERGVAIGSQSFIRK